MNSRNFLSLVYFATAASTYTAGIVFAVALDFDNSDATQAIVMMWSICVVHVAFGWKRS